MVIRNTRKAKWVLLFLFEAVWVPGSAAVLIMSSQGEHLYRAVVLALVVSLSCVVPLCGAVWEWSRMRGVVNTEIVIRPAVVVSCSLPVSALAGAAVHFVLHEAWQNTSIYFAGSTAAILHLAAFVAAVRLGARPLSRSASHG